MSSEHLFQIRQTLADPRLQDAIQTATARKVTRRLVSVEQASLPEFELWRTQAHRVKQHTLRHLDYYIERFEAALSSRGGTVAFARDGAEAVEFVADVARRQRARVLVKSKSMTMEEIGLRQCLTDRELEVTETDLGEYLVQLTGERPFHITAPALHMTRHDVADLFHERLAVPRETDPAKQTRIARKVLRESFLSAGIGVTGANFLVAESGTAVIVENEGNVRLSSSCPRVQVVVVGIEKLIPRSRDLVTFLKLLGRSAGGQELTVYTSLLTGPRRTGETDGPDEFYVVLLDNGRTRVLADRSKRETLFCIRCGACVNQCPVYRRIGGHSYPGVYSGPIGAILTPQIEGLAEVGWLPFASSLCGACGHVCPVKIDIPRILLELRSEVVKARPQDWVKLLERLAFRLWAQVMRRPQLYEAMSIFRDIALGGPGVGPSKAWRETRDLPAAPPKTFRQVWRERKQPRAS